METLEYQARSLYQTWCLFAEARQTEENKRKAQEAKAELEKVLEEIERRKGNE